MSLPHITKYIYKTGSEEAIIRGKKIFLTEGVRLIHNDDVVQKLTFRVRNDIYKNYFNVTISQYTDEERMEVECKCPYNMGDVCRHEAAALYFLNELIITNSLDSKDNSFDQKNTVIKMRNLELKLFRLYTSDENFTEAGNIAKLNKAKIFTAANEYIEADLPYNGETFELKLKRNDNGTINTSCTCEEKHYPLCVHKTALFLQLLNNYGTNYFDTIRNWDKQKNLLLGLYGYSLEDDLTDKFEFYYKEGKPFLKVLDKTIKKVNQTERVVPDHLKKPEEKIASPSDYTKSVGVVIDLNVDHFPNFKLEAIEGKKVIADNTFTSKVSVLDTSKYINLNPYAPDDRAVVNATKKLQAAEINKFISKNSPFGDLWESLTTDEDWTEENKKLFYEYALPRLHKLFGLIGDQVPLFILPKGKALKIANLSKINISFADIEMKYILKGKVPKTKLSIHYGIGRNHFKQEENLYPGFSFFLTEDLIFLPKKGLDANCSDRLYNNFPAKKSEWDPYMENVVLPYSRTKNIELDKSLVKTAAVVAPKQGLLLNERGNMFILKPIFLYGQSELDFSDEKQFPSIEGGQIVMIQRDKDAEKAFMDQIEALHQKMKKNSHGNAFVLESKYALSENWMYMFFQKMKQSKIQLFGYDNLKQFKFKKIKPKTHLSVTSNIDWFDTEVELDFAGEQADLKEIQKSIRTKQNFVKLKDGTLGLLPEEWLKKYSLLFKMADIKENKLKVSKVNFHIIDELYDNIDQEDVKLELDEKKKMLLRVDVPKEGEIIVPEDVKADLRPYQKSGFRWLNYLQEVNWGGLLADDMGLGKTIQSLTILQDYKNENEVLKAIIVCPTTLLYNWKEEIEKFTPTLTYYIHHGSSRTAKFEVIDSHDIIITTYGTLRSDIAFLNKNEFDYIILDESQAIKNPTSKTAKAAMILQGKNRIALSGTPMQNNTFDIYSQMHFLNPGMLGSKEFFKEQFAVPIDKYQEVEAKSHLKKLIFPFLLRRTKEQVAKDLPKKTEITLTCEMGKEQKKIYEQYRNLYRSKILGELDTKGLNKSQFSILQGLMRLRQICDSPSIIKGAETTEAHSIKLDELSSQLHSVVGEHKVLIFSQFLGMLSLIREKLTAEGIKFEYFDGSSTTTQRQAAIKNFQEDESTRVFLISLKAGGMGLNLTAADYVYLMDPWWNPAVEQQAIDRTHRIGQTQNIFAYRFICKDTVEEKIMKLKAKKNSLVKDIISDDSKFVKNLSKEDIEYLFT